MKVKINDTPLFKQVSEVIGSYNAFIHIGKTKITELSLFEKPLNKGITPWNKTPQGFKFWYSINQGYNPIKK